MRLSKFGNNILFSSSKQFTTKLTQKHTSGLPEGMKFNPGGKNAKLSEKISNMHKEISKIPSCTKHKSHGKSEKLEEAMQRTVKQCQSGGF